MLPLLFSLVASAGEISGVVLDTATGNPVVGVPVFAASNVLPEGASALTDDDGRFSMPNLPAGTYTVTTNYAGAVAEDTVILPDVGTANISLSVALAESEAQTYTITGTRIRSTNQQAVSPVSSIGEEDIKLQGSTSIETVINTLPQTFATQGSTVSN